MRFVSTEKIRASPRVHLVTYLIIAHSTNEQSILSILHNVFQSL